MKYIEGSNKQTRFFTFTLVFVQDTLFVYNKFVRPIFVYNNIIILETTTICLANQSVQNKKLRSAHFDSVWTKYMSAYTIFLRAVHYDTGRGATQTAGLSYWAVLEIIKQVISVFSPIHGTKIVEIS